jgi:predicted nucleic acid-binding protein
MNNENKDVITLIELLKMAAERRRRSTDQISEDEPFSEDLSLLEMWPEACRRTGEVAHFRSG